MAVFAREARYGKGAYMNGTDSTCQPSIFVIPAKAGIHFQAVKIKIDPGFRRDDDAKSVPFGADIIRDSVVQCSIRYGRP